MGAGVFARGDVVLTDSTVSGNTTTGFNANGGGVAVIGTLTLTDSTVSNNSTSGDFAFGGGIYIPFSSVARLTNSTISGNHTMGAGADGGGIWAERALMVHQSTIAGNHTYGANSAGGGVYAADDLTLTRNTISGNSAAGRGGGIFSDVYGRGNLTISGSTVSGNYTTVTGGDGGGIFVRGDSLVAYSTVTDNHAPGASSSGGGILHDSGTLTISGSLVAANTAAGDHDIDARMGPPNVDHSLIGHNRGAGLLGTIDNVPDANGNLIGGLPGGDLSGPLQVSIDIAAMGEFESVATIVCNSITHSIMGAFSLYLRFLSMWATNGSTRWKTAPTCFSLIRCELLAILRLTILFKPSTSSFPAVPGPVRWTCDSGQWPLTRPRRSRFAILSSPIRVRVAWWVEQSCQNQTST